ncbi:MAG: Asp-tRNA(Asn)/Glu-tRNA(Gln) amidotransferase subunit GatB [Myxococcota bacterium]|nr:Asp-tRNA(Asn)/Glu-tRNA(Gln) amidotransferase subunit GatB [Myxococcota bacterium]MDW8363165.1 Asp-tRNA(Asn)/Glu-tRNA(Gln) amidotransferase subunit GatB [Myxococcales bacterium]
MSAWEAVIGLEVHAQLLTRAKLFCACSTAFGAPPNTNVCPVCLGLPGALPVPSEEAVEMAVAVALALGCRVQPRSRWARKNYFYPDLAKGYQISQFDAPLALGGALEVDGVTVRIRRVHLEEDAAKNLHGVAAGSDTLVDFNRAGVPLVEIVGEPDLRSAEQAERYLRALRETLMFARVNDGNLEEGSFRCDANVSVRPVGRSELGTRVEIKNLNSFRFVRRALQAEIRRQIGILESGGQVVHETRGYREGLDDTVPQRTKEQAHDYRYFPDPDLPELRVDEALVRRVAQRLPESAASRRARWQQTLGLTAYDAQVLTGHPAIADWFDAAVAAAEGRLGAGGPKRIANFATTELLRVVSIDGLRAHIPVSPDRVVELLELVERGTLSGSMAKDVFARMVATGRSARAIAETEGLVQLSDEAAIEAVCRQVLEAHPKELARFRAGKTNVAGFFVGQVMRQTGGRAQPDLVRRVLDRLLGA